MDNNLTFHKTLNTELKPLTNDKSWDKVLEAYKIKDFKAVIIGIIDYVDLSLVEKYGNAEKTEFNIPHGSVELKLTISDTHFTVKAPFLNISESKKIPLLRKVTELNFSPLNLSSIILDGEELAFEYKCLLNLCEPYKTYDALKEICVYADSYDDEFISKFDAKWIQEPSISSFSQEVKNTAWDNMQLYIQEANDAIQYFETKRSLSFAWDVLAITLMKLEYYIKPQGLLRIEIEKTISYLLGNNDPMPTKVSRGKSFLDKLKTYDRASFEADLYSVNTFIPYKVRSNNQAVKNNAENSFAQAKKEREQGNHLAATMTLVYQFFYLFYHNNVPSNISSLIENGLSKASGKPWVEASNILFKTLERIMKDDVGSTSSPEKKKGFFSKLFG